MLLVDKFAKRYHYPMGKVQRVEQNSLGEVTAVYVLKGTSGETVYRHVTSLILLLPSEGDYSTNSDVDECSNTSDHSKMQRPRRKAAESCKEKIRNIYSSD